MKQSKFLFLSLFLTVSFISCKPQSQYDYERECREIDLKQKRLNYLQKLYYVKTDIEFTKKIKMLDSLIQNSNAE